MLYTDIDVYMESNLIVASTDTIRTPIQVLQLLVQ